MLLVDIERVEEVIDLICAGEHAAFNRWIDSLAADLAKFEALMRQASATEGRLDIQHAAHSIKGACLNIGLLALSDLFAELEHDAKTGQTAAVKQRYAANRAVEAQSLQALREIAASDDFNV